MEQYKSLYEYLGRAAGADLGEGTPLYVYGGGHERILELMSNY